MEMQPRTSHTSPCSLNPSDYVPYHGTGHLFMDDWELEELHEKCDEDFWYDEEERHELF